mgnify:CR=1 FL=1
MAISQITYSNTFSHWMVTTNQLVSVVNTLSFGDFYKNQGTLYLNSPTLGLQVANNAVVQGQLQVSGIGSSAYIQKNLQVENYATMRRHYQRVHEMPLQRDTKPRPAVCQTNCHFQVDKKVFQKLN